jgi:hypothetical protein
MKPAADNQFPPWSGAKVELASYATIEAPDIAAALACIAQARISINVACARIEQAMTSLSTDAHGEPREPSLNEREALEDLRCALELLR